MMPKFSFCVGSWMRVEEARFVSSCFSWPSRAGHSTTMKCTGYFEVLCSFQVSNLSNLLFKGQVGRMPAAQVI